ncbi:cytochrome c oxidase assembly protein [Sporosarcina sp. P16b]|uniref:SCO family protein n=1 Tax=Sporosarcina sp. P16b TaxID=2048261 RepID=UPI000C16D72F|nr:SCO family protein [Sporosarcina sp. P16b]PIC69013.1 cytochrome c oxidase assembly protein [Sporosarcina sp. P16b]
MNIRSILILLAAVFLLSACHNKIETNRSEKLPDFDYTTQDENKLGLDDLIGDWWISYFSYTRCTTVCPRTTANMVDIQRALKNEGLTPRIISFSIDPENDTPEVLREYAKDYSADLETMTFLTGYDFEEIRDLSVTTFKAVLEKGALDQRSHSFFFYLINPDGEIVKQYNGMSDTDNELLVADVKKVLGK